MRQQVSDRIEENVEEQPPYVMVIIQPEDDTKAAVETIPKEHEGSHVAKLKRQELTEEIIKVIDEYQDVSQRIYQQEYLRYAKVMNFILTLKKGLNL